MFAVGKISVQIFVAGFGPAAVARLDGWVQRVLLTASWPDPDPPKKKVFKPKFNLPLLADYHVNPPANFWDTFPSRQSTEATSLVCPVRLRELANQFGLSKHPLLETICKDLSEGADIGCRGLPRLPSTSNNAPSAFEFGPQVTDAVADWLNQGFAAGPFYPADRPATAKVSGIMCREKPNGSARIILNFSAPEGTCVNDGINSDEFPTSMTSTAKWVAILNRAGRGALMLKMDWAAAYKHIHVRPADRVLQFFSWLGMDFVELMLVFGACSSAGIYDRLAKFILLLVLAYCRFPPDMVGQFLDDVCAACPARSTALHRFEAAYRAVAAMVGVKLASTDDPEKAFSPCTAGVVLGVEYDTVAWTWRIPQDKLVRLLLQLRGALEADQLPQHEIWSLVGRLLHYGPLIPASRFNIGHLIKASSISSNRRFPVFITPDMKRQLHFWFVILRATDGLVSIPTPVNTVPAWAVEFYTDAAGGSQMSIGQGTGGIGRQFWFMVPWGRKINSSMRDSEGRQLRKKLSALELVGPLICIASGAALCRSKPVRIWVDNAGSVAIWRKGYSNSCPLCTTLVAAIGRVAAALGSVVAIDKITRCSNTSATLADELSKGRLSRFRQRLPADWVLPTDPAWIPPAILQWIADPVARPDLGDRILADLRERIFLL